MLLQIQVLWDLNEVLVRGRRRGLELWLELFGVIPKRLGLTGHWFERVVRVKLLEVGVFFVQVYVLFRLASEHSDVVLH